MTQKLVIIERFNPAHYPVHFQACRGVRLDEGGRFIPKGMQVSSDAMCDEDDIDAFVDTEKEDEEELPETEVIIPSEADLLIAQSTPSGET